MTMIQKKPYSIDACRICGTLPKNGAVEGICSRCMLTAGLVSEGVGISGSTANISAAGAFRKKTPRFKPPSLQEISSEFPNLEVIEVAGVGGMGVVYKVKQKDLGRTVALKILPSEIASDPSFTARFSQEARALGMLSHPNVVHLYDAGKSENYYYLLMEYVDGINLRQAIAEGNLKPTEALSIVKQICDGLQFAHQEGIVHRDIKPENILIDKNGTIKVADFGLAKLVDAGMNLTATQQVMGTLHYMAPEQIQQTREVDHRADLYSLGVVFYEMLTGKLPLGKFAVPSESGSVDQRLDAVVLRTLENEPDQRYQSASDIQSDIVSFKRARKKQPELEGVESLRSRIRSMLFLPAVVMTAASVIQIALSIYWIIKTQWIFDEPTAIEITFLLFPVILLIAGLQMLRGRWVGFFQLVSILFWFSSGENLFYQRLAHVLGLHQLEGMEQYPFSFSLTDLFTITAIFCCLASIVSFCSRTGRDFGKARRQARNAKLLSQIPSFSIQEQKSAASQLRLTSMAMFLVGLMGSIFLAWSTFFNGHGFPHQYPSFASRWFTLTCIATNVAMMLSGIWLYRSEFYKFHEAVAWIALLPFVLILPTLYVLYPLNIATGVFSLWVLHRDSVKLLFVKTRLESDRLL